MDASLLETEYDAVIVGTGMAEAILAGALARVGKKVLHLDQNDYYGSNYASFPLEQFLRWTRNETIAPRDFRDEDTVQDPSNENEASSSSSSSAEAAATATTSEATTPDASSPMTREIPLSSTFRCHLVEETFSALSDEERAKWLGQSTQFNIDVNPRLVLSSEEIVQLLITSGVGRYLEFAAMERTYVHVPTASDAAADTIWEVPCSKKDVFSSKLLGMVEKRQLMKFLQFVADYGETHIRGEDVKSKNERELALGRSLKRPQNKASVAETEDSAIAAYLDRPFQALLSEHFKLSAKLQQVVVYCVALASFPVGSSQSAAQQMTAREGLAAVYRYVASIGRFTGNAFLVPLYGVSEITQSFCRLCAVYGGIYVLRAPISNYVIDKEANEVVGIRCTDGGLVRSKCVITNASYISNFQAEAAMTKETSPTQILRGVFFVRSSLRLEMNRFMLVIPPEDTSLGNPFVVQVIQLDHGAYVCPKDHYLIQATTPIPKDWQGDQSRQQSLMNAIIQRLLESASAEKRQKQATFESAPDPDVEKVWSDAIVWKAIYAMDHYAFSYSNATKHADYVQPTGLPKNVWICETSTTDSVSPLEIHLEGASINARAIFEQLCPGEEFLPKSASAEQAEKEELEDEQDAVLKAAQKLAAEADQIVAEDAPGDASVSEETPSRDENEHSPSSV